MFAFWVVWPPTHVSHCSSLMLVPRLVEESALYIISDHII